MGLELIFEKKAPVDDHVLKDTLERSERILGMLPHAEVSAAFTLRADLSRAQAFSGEQLERAGWRFSGVEGPGAPDVSGWGLSPSQALAVAPALLAGGDLPDEIRAASLIKDEGVPEGLAPAAAVSDFLDAAGGAARTETAPESFEVLFGNFRISLLFGKPGVLSWEIREGDRPPVVSEKSGLSSLGSYLASILRMAGGAGGKGARS